MKLIQMYGSAKVTIEVPDSDEPSEDLGIILLNKHPSKIRVEHSQDDGYFFQGTLVEFRQQISPSEKRKQFKSIKRLHLKLTSEQ